MTQPGEQHHAPQAVLPKPARFGKLAWTALVLGVLGVLGSPIVLLNNLTAVTAGVGLVLGVIALFGTRKVLSVVGVALCVAGIATTVAVQTATVRELDRLVDGPVHQGRVGDRGADPADAARTPAESPTWGERHTWPDGLAVEVSAPAVCAPSEFSVPRDVARAVKFTVTVVNGTDRPFEAGVLAVGDDAQFDGRKAEKVFDSGGACGDGLESATVMPGKTYSYEVAYAVGARAGEMQIALQPRFGADRAVFAGRA